MSEPRWADVEVGDAIIADRKATDVTISGTVSAFSVMSDDWLGLGGDGFNISAQRWTLLDIIKPEPQLPTAIGSVVRFNGLIYATDNFGWFGPHGRVLTCDLSGAKVIYDAGKK